MILVFVIVLTGLVAALCICNGCMEFDPKRRLKAPKRITKDGNGKFYAQVQLWLWPKKWHYISYCEYLRVGPYNNCEFDTIGEAERRLKSFTSKAQKKLNSQVFEHVVTFTENQVFDEQKMEQLLKEYKELEKAREKHS